MTTVDTPPRAPIPRRHEVDRVALTVPLVMLAIVVGAGWLVVRLTPQPETPVEAVGMYLSAQKDGDFARVWDLSCTKEQRALGDKDVFAARAETRHLAEVEDLELPSVGGAFEIATLPVVAWQVTVGDGTGDAHSTTNYLVINEGGGLRVCGLARQARW